MDGLTRAIIDRLEASMVAGGPEWPTTGALMKLTGASRHQIAKRMRRVREHFRELGFVIPRPTKRNGWALQLTYEEDAYEAGQIVNTRDHCTRLASTYRDAKVMAARHPNDPKFSKIGIYASESLRWNVMLTEELATVSTNAQQMLPVTAGTVAA